MSKLIRSNVCVVVNAHGGVYEVTDDPNLMKVQLEQTSVWWEGNNLKREVRQVEHFTDISLFKKGTVLPGNICIAFTTEPILFDDLNEFLHYDREGNISKSFEGIPIYSYLYYSPLSKYSCDGYLEDDDVLEDLTMPVI